MNCIIYSMLVEALLRVQYGNSMRCMVEGYFLHIVLAWQCFNWFEVFLVMALIWQS